MAENRRIIPKEGCMRVDVTIFGSPAILSATEPEAIRQISDAACLPGVVGALAMPDIHSGYGLPIGGVLAVDARSGVVSPGAVGVDINCGVRAVRVPARYTELQPHLERLFKSIVRNVATGVGSKSRSEIGQVRGAELRRLVEGGVPELVQDGYATPHDVECTEEQGNLQPASLEAVSAKARSRGEGQIGTLGSGNHFLELQRVAEVFDQRLANAIGLEQDGVCLMIHCGSRGFGEQVCQDYMRSLATVMGKYGISPPNRNLACVPIDSPEGQSYLKAMACAANYAWVNRQVILHEVRRVFKRELRIEGLELIYDVAHNIAKFEEHGGRRLLIHRKGATRAFPAGRPEVPACYRAIGQPAIIPGSMGTSSFIVVGTEATLRETYGSVNHGAGRLMSRSAAVGPGRGKKGGGRITEDGFRQSMKGIFYMSGSGEDMLDEAPAVYKDSVEVVNSLADIGLLQRVVRLVPMAVLKG